MYADIVVDITHEKLNRTFQYRIPDELLSQIVLGCRVDVPFGKGDRTITGYVVELFDEPRFAADKTKAIIAIHPMSVTADSRMIALAFWMKRHFGGTLQAALKTVLPVKEQVAPKESQTLVRTWTYESLRAFTDKYAQKKGASPQKLRLLEALCEETAIPREAAADRLLVGAAAIRDLEKRGILRIEKSRTYRNPLSDDMEGKKPISLNEKQQAVADVVTKDFESGRRGSYLLWGVTGSGKTEVYMEMIDHVVRAGYQAIVLIPEISLTYQTVMRFYGRFGDRISILNSRMSKGERYDQLERAKNGEVDIIIGPRSALFVPFPKLGLIIIDEEHETSYKSETVPKYNARETAEEICKLCNASLVLGSATPSIDSFYKASVGDYRLLELRERVEDRPLPSCEVVDLAAELKAGNRTILSERLQELIEDRLSKGEQSMLFINRRGVAGMLSCRVCGKTIKCPHCDVSLTEHNDEKLMCHYCGHAQVKPAACPSCGQPKLAGFKSGTEKIETMLKTRFKGARILRMDADTTAKKGDYERLLTSFADGEADIMVGTQMIVKGHDFPRVTLMGVLAADTSLNVGDYRAAERTFQLLTQAAGRAGRGELPGNVVIQTYQPEHYSVLMAKDQDYKAFYNTEIAYRELLNYPPAGHLLCLMLSSKKKNDLLRAAALAKECATQASEGRRILILGPMDARIAYINDENRMQMYLKSSDYEALVDVKDSLESYMLEEAAFRYISTSFDFDPS